jgi:hypothetical protein
VGEEAPAVLEGRGAEGVSAGGEELLVVVERARGVGGCGAVLGTQLVW